MSVFKKKSLESVGFLEKIQILEDMCGIVLLMLNLPRRSRELFT